MSGRTDYTVEDTSRARLAASPEGVKALVDARLIITAHWGLYSLIGRGEWVMYHEKISYEKYRPLMERFNPTRFDAGEWADLVLESGAKDLLITTKHHDGFCLWDTALTDFKVTNTPFKRDIIAELAEALCARGMRLHYYYSILDWTHPAYRSDWPAYVEYYQGQLKELLSNYGRIAGVVFDGYWPRFEFAEDQEHFKPGGAWDLAGTYDLIHQLQPDCVVGNNHHVLPLKGEDYQVFELDLPGENSIGFNTTDVAEMPLVTWETLNWGWSYNPARHAVKTSGEITRKLFKANNAGATMFLNLCPRPFGDNHPAEAARMREIGELLRHYLK